MSEESEFYYSKPLRELHGSSMNVSRRNGKREHELWFEKWKCVYIPDRQCYLDTQGLSKQATRRRLDLIDRYDQKEG